MTNIDLNSDLGESYGHYRLGNDDQIIPLISACNIACGYHAGDPNVMAKTVQTAENNNIGIGAHPSFPDRTGFGRRYMEIDDESIKNLVSYQISALAGFTSDHKLHHVKPHGALYNRAGKDLNLAKAICAGIKRVDPNLPIYALANSKLVTAAKEVGIPYAEEVYADRNYQSDGSLVPRSQANAVLADPDKIAERAISMIKNHSIRSIDGDIVPLQIDSICVHGDNPTALTIVNTLIKALKAHQIQIKPFIPNN